MWLKRSGFHFRCSRRTAFIFIRLFSTIEESAFRVAATHFLRQYFIEKATKKIHYSLKVIKEQYKLTRKVNIGMLARIKNISKLDADKNGIVTLNSVAEILEMEMDTDLESIQSIFK